MLGGALRILRIFIQTALCIATRYSNGANCEPIHTNGLGKRKQKTKEALDITADSIAYSTEF